LAVTPSPSCTPNAKAQPPGRPRDLHPSKSVAGALHRFQTVLKWFPNGQLSFFFHGPEAQPDAPGEYRKVAREIPDVFENNHSLYRHRKPLLAYAKRPPVSAAYQALAEEIEAKMNARDSSGPS
jgi:hypothetical protein